MSQNIYLKGEPMAAGDWWKLERRGGKGEVRKNDCEMRNGGNLRGLPNRYRKRAAFPKTWAAAKGVLRNKAHASTSCSSTSNPNNLQFWGNMLEI
jgi:hypothetical protein